MTYRILCRRLSDAGIDTPSAEAALLLSHFCGVSHASLMADPDREWKSDALEDAVRRRIERQPLQYILGEWSFFEETYTVSPHCLIPRADTEILVEHAIRALPHGAHFADLCTGSGCIAISTLAHRPDCKALAVDLFPETLALARHNAERNGVADRLKFQQADVLDPRIPDAEAPFDAILANPPYIPSTTVDTLDPELAFEPRAALDGGEDGLIFYRAIVKNFAQHLTPKGFILFEIGYDQEQALKTIAASCGFVCSVERDLAGNPRVARLDRRKDHYGTNH